MYLKDNKNDLRMSRRVIIHPFSNGIGIVLHFYLQNICAYILNVSLSVSYSNFQGDLRILNVYL